MEFQKKVLDNGLTVLFEKRDVPVTTVMLAAKFGSAYESEEEKGMAHFMEHLCFKGTKKRTTQEIAEEVERLGGDLNAFTHEEVTAYHVRLPSEHLETAMDVIFDIYFNAQFPEEEVSKECQVICEEIKMYKDNPRHYVLDSIKKSLYEAPFGLNIAGSESNVRAMSRDMLFSKHQKVYVPKNSVLVVVGNNDFEDVVRFAEELTPETSGESLEVPKIILKKNVSSESRKGIVQTNLALGFHFPFQNERGEYAAEVFSSILGNGMSSKLFKEVREKRGLVYGVKSEQDVGKHYGYLVIWAGTDKSKEEEVIRVCLDEFSKMKDITEEELAEAKIQLIGNRHVSSESSSDVAVSLIMEEISGDAKDYYLFEDKINSVTLTEVRELSEKTEHSLFSLGPEEE
ncbi:insulinase family protein [archaeon]|jgi:predicted Zn-dependent peptidase|nr:insulinase family protein [archaeon]MBT6182449.1 insulinase family protein [archaeon]MBT6606039.1 insulinase family protein [archaeon]MBT7251682.1 insulinase family protein [archaeon]MBT7660698.1 insulinase family protein [archaeon]